jgi:hypothetical protein
MPVQAEWVDPEDQIWLARHVRQWVTDPAHKFMNPQAPNEFEKELLGLLDSVEGLKGDIDLRIENLHEIWKHSGFLTKQWYRTKIASYLLKGAGYEISERARKMKTKSATQMLANWGRISIIVNAQNGGDWMVSKAWIGPVTEKQEPGPALAPPSWGPVVEKPEATLAAPSWGPALAPGTWGPAAEEKPSWLRRAMGEWTDVGGGRYVSKSGAMAEGPLARLLYGPIAHKLKAKGPEEAPESV